MNPELQQKNFWHPKLPQWEPAQTWIKGKLPWDKILRYLYNRRLEIIADFRADKVEAEQIEFNTKYSGSRNLTPN